MTPGAAHEQRDSGLLNIVLGAAELALNTVLRMDPYTQREWAKLKDRLIAIEATGVSQPIWIAVEADRLRVVSRPQREPDIRIAGSPIALARLTGPRRFRDSALQSEVTFTGSPSEVALARELIAGFEIDWEEHLSRVTGDVAAHQIGNVFRSAARWLEQTAQALVSDAGEYVRYEARQVPDAYELQRFQREVEELATRVDGLDSRVRRLPT